MGRRWTLTALGLDGALLLFLAPVTWFLGEVLGDVPWGAVALGLSSVAVAGAAAGRGLRQPGPVAATAFVVAHLGLVAAAWLYLESASWLLWPPLVALLAAGMAWRGTETAPSLSD